MVKISVLPKLIKLNAFIIKIQGFVEIDKTIIKFIHREKGRNLNCLKCFEKERSRKNQNTQCQLFGSVQFSHSVLSDSLQNNGLQHTRLHHVQ